MGAKVAVNLLVHHVLLDESFFLVPTALAAVVESDVHLLLSLIERVFDPLPSVHDGYPSVAG